MKNLSFIQFTCKNFQYLETFSYTQKDYTIEKRFHVIQIKITLPKCGINYYPFKRILKTSILGKTKNWCGVMWWDGWKRKSEWVKWNALLYAWNLFIANENEEQNEESRNHLTQNKKKIIIYLEGFLLHENLSFLSERWLHWWEGWTKHGKRWKEFWSCVLLSNNFPQQNLRSMKAYRR